MSGTFHEIFRTFWRFDCLQELCEAIFQVDLKCKMSFRVSNLTLRSAVFKRLALVTARLPFAVIF
jgi:hypothetical protein